MRVLAEEKPDYQDEIQHVFYPIYTDCNGKKYLCKREQKFYNF